MKKTNFSKNEMKERELFSNLRIFPPFAVRIDGRGFRGMLDSIGAEKPYDIKFAQAMADSVECFFKKSGFVPMFAFTFSDEVNFFFSKIPYNKRVEKINSIIPSFISSELTIKLNLKTPISYDSRIILLGKEDIYKYLLWRQAETWRNHVSSYGYYTFLKSGLSKSEAFMKLNHLKTSSIHELLFKNGVNLAHTPTWQRCGILIYRGSYQKVGFDPIRKIEVKTERTKIVQDWNPPIFNTEEGKKLINRLISSQ